MSINEMESLIENHQEEEEDEVVSKQKKEKEIFLRRLLLLLNCIILTIGATGGPLLLRLYFLRGGKRIWLSCWLQTGGWPIMFIPLLCSYWYRRSKKTTRKVQLFYMTPFLFTASAVLGLLTGLDDYLYAYGLAKLPVSTSSLLLSTQLAFTAGFAFLLVKQKFTSYTINAIVLLTVGAFVLGIHSNSDHPDGESKVEYFTGFFLTLGAAALYGLVLPMIELTYKKSKTKITYTLVIEMQLIMSMFAAGFCIIGMLVNKDFQAIPREAKANPLGEANYYLVLVSNTIVWQFGFLGVVGVVFCSSSLFYGILIAVLLPLLACLAVVFFHEKFTAEKGISLALSLWGFVSYFYGEFKRSKKLKKTTDFPRNNVPPGVEIV